MKKKVRIYLVEKNGKQDVLSANQERTGHIPNTVDKVRITWGSGEEKQILKVKDFKDNYKHLEGCYWTAKEVV